MQQLISQVIAANEAKAAQKATGKASTHGMNDKPQKAATSKGLPIGANTDSGAVKSAKAAQKQTGPAKKNPSASKAAPKVEVKAAQKPATKPAQKGFAQAATKAEPMAIKYAVSDFARPTAGRALAAHTAAFLGLSGMGAGAAIPRSTVTKIIGARAVQYHTGNGNFEATSAGLKLSAKGEIAFLSRTIDPELLKAYEEVMQTGKLNDAANVKIEAARIKL